MLGQPRQLSFDLPNFGQPESAHRLVCYQWGEQAPAVICVHGLTRNGRDFDYLAAALAPSFTAYAPDMPGRGQSQWLIDSKGYNNAAYIADLAAIIAKWGMTRLHWIGTSMGGILGMMMANQFPGLLQSLVLNDIGCTISAAGLKRILSYPAVSAYATRTQAEAALRERCATFDIREESHWQHLFAHSIQQNADGTFRLAYDPAIIGGIPKDDIKDIDLWPLWEAVTKIPVLVIRGAESDLLARETAMKMQATHPRLTFKEIAGAGHAPALMDDTQTRLIADWITQQR